MNIKAILKKYKRKFIYFMYGGEAYQKYWKYRKREKIETYLADMHDPHRVWLTGFFNHANSILEVGCDWGGNLILMSQTRSQTCKFYGVDISPESIELGRKYCLEQTINNVELMEGRAEELSFFPDSSIDIVFSDMMLLYLGPREIKKAIKEFLRIANDSIYLLEFHSTELTDKGDNTEDGWIYNYTKLLQPLVGSATVSLIQLPGGIHPVGRWNDFATLIKIKKKK